MRFKKRFLNISIALLAAFTITTQTAYSSESNTEIKQDTSSFVNFKRYYYNQLNEVEKEIYNNLILFKESFLNGEEITFPIQPCAKNNKQEEYVYYATLMKRVVRAFTYDNPEAAIWFNNYKRGYFFSNDYTYLILRPKNLNELNTNLSVNNIRIELSEFEKISSDFVKTLSGTDMEKLKNIHDWLIQRTEYDYSYMLPDTGTAYGTIVEQRSVCSGFAAAYKYIADLAGLQTLYVTGKFRDTQTGQYVPHAWNIVYVNKQYYLVDVTLDKAFKNIFLLSSVNNNTHYIDRNYFNYPNFE